MLGKNWIRDFCLLWAWGMLLVLTLIVVENLHSSNPPNWGVWITAYIPFYVVYPLFVMHRARSHHMFTKHTKTE